MTEVVDLPSVAARSAETAPAVAAQQTGAFAETSTALSSGISADIEQHIIQRVLADVLRQTDMMLEYRLREAIAPMLARVTDQLIGETRDELARTLQDVVARAVAQELAKYRTRPSL